MPFLNFRRDHLRSTPEIICGLIWGSFPVGDHLRRCTVVNAYVALITFSDPIDYY